MWRFNMKLERCVKCQGSKKVAPMGGMYVTCLNCNGKGYVECNDKATYQQSIPHSPTITAPETVIESPAVAPAFTTTINKVETPAPTEADTRYMEALIDKSVEKLNPSLEILAEVPQSKRRTKVHKSTDHIVT